MAIKLENGTGRRVSPTIKAIRAALEGATSFVGVAGTEIAITLDDHNAEIDVSDGFGTFETFELAEAPEAIRRFLELAEG